MEDTQHTIDWEEIMTDIVNKHIFLRHNGPAKKKHGCRVSGDQKMCVNPQQAHQTRRADETIIMAAQRIYFSQIKHRVPEEIPIPVYFQLFCELLDPECHHGSALCPPSPYITMSTHILGSIEPPGLIP